jgi:hypothetical protein
MRHQPSKIYAALAARAELFLAQHNASGSLAVSLYLSSKCRKYSTQ